MGWRNRLQSPLYPASERATDTVILFGALNMGAKRVGGDEIVGANKESQNASFLLGNEEGDFPGDNSLTGAFVGFFGFTPSINGEGIADVFRGEKTNNLGDTFGETPTPIIETG